MKIWAFKKKDGFSCDDYGHIALAVVARIQLIRQVCKKNE
jgi:hypothetical protein